MTQIHTRKGVGEGLQNRIEPHLRAHLQPHWAVASWFLAHARGARYAAKLVARKARHASHIEGIVRREWAGMHRVGDSPAPTELHGANIHFVHLRGDDRAVALLDERARDAAPPKLARKR